MTPDTIRNLILAEIALEVDTFQIVVATNSAVQGQDII
jgi:hypothetical protein